MNQGMWDWRLRTATGKVMVESLVGRALRADNWRVSRALPCLPRNTRGEGLDE